MKRDHSPFHSHLRSTAGSCRFSATTMGIGLGKGLARCQQDGVVFRVSFPSSDNAINIGRIKLDKVAASSRLMGGNQRGPAAAEAVENNCIAFRSILDR